MIVLLILVAIVLLVGFALRNIRMDERAQRRLERNEYRPLVMHIWHH